MPIKDNDLSAADPKLVAMMNVILKELGIDTTRPHFQDTPKRFIKALMDATDAIRTPEPRFTLFPNKEDVNGIVMLKRLRVVSLCSHHLYPWMGYVTVAYIPDKWLVGASKFSRVIDWMSAFPSAQEIFTEQLADFIQKKAEPVGLMVISEATHSCMVARGANEEESSLVYSAVRGVMAENKNPRAEALKLLGTTINK
jgi:GTP cyclohydrolase I